MIIIPRTLGGNYREMGLTMEACQAKTGLEIISRSQTPKSPLLREIIGATSAPM